MATLPAMIPEIPNVDETLPALCPPALGWAAVRASVQGVTGKSLVELADVDKTLAEMELQRLQDEDARLRDYPKQYKTWWENEALFPVPIPALGATLQLPVGKIIKLGKALDKVRIEIEQRCEIAREQRATIFSDWQVLVGQRTKEETARRIAEQDAKAAAEKQAELDRLETQRATLDPQDIPEIDALIDDVRTAPLIPATVNERQVEQSIFAAPKGLSRGRTVYIRKVEDKVELLRWLVANPTLIDSIIPGFNFTAFKRSKERIPGAPIIGSRVEGITNRGK